MRPEDLHADGRLTADGWRHGWTGPGGPDFKSPADSPGHAETVHALARAAGLDGAAWATQVHGPEVRRVTAPGWSGEADALWTDVPGLAVVGRSADCPLVLVGGSRPDGTRVAGFAHASWRSTVRGITRGLVEAMTRSGATPGSLAAVICPCAGPCCYEVGPEVRAAALEALGPDAAVFFLPRGDRDHFDLWSANRAQLTGAGVPDRRIALPSVCTICDPAGWPSYRRQGHAAGRLAAIIGC